MGKIVDNITAKGNLTVQVTGPDGAIKDKREFKNLVVTVGKEFIAARMIDASIPDEMSHMAIGSGATGAGEAALADQGLTTEEARVGLTGGAGTVKTGADNTIVYEATFGQNTPASAAGITEAGLFNAASAGTMLCRTTFAVVNKGTDDTLAITWEVSIN